MSKFGRSSLLALGPSRFASDSVVHARAARDRFQSEDIHDLKDEFTGCAEASLRPRFGSFRGEEVMFELKQCKQCAQTIESGELFARFKNPAADEPPLFFHHRGRGDCYWQYLRDRVLKVQGQPRQNNQAA
jgi:hypothetical protein